MKKLLLLLTISIFLLAACENKELVQVLDSYSQQLKTLNEDVNADFMIIGDDKYIDKKLNYRKIDALTEANLKSGEEHGYRCLFINDIEGDLVLSDVEFDQLAKFVIDEDGDVLYYGTQYLKKLCDWLGIREISSPNEGLGIYGCFPDKVNGDLGAVACVGVWTAKSKEIYKEANQYLTQTLVVEFVQCATGESYEYLNLKDKWILPKP